MTDDLFAGDQQQTDPWIELTKEGGKFDKTKYQAEDELKKAVARGKIEADQTIEQMKTRLDELREDNKRMFEERKAGTTLKDYVDQLKTLQPSQGTPTLNAENVNAPQVEDIDKLLDTKIAQREQAKIEQTNLNTVQQKLKERYGSNYQDILSEQRDNLKLTAAQVNDLARTSPEAFFKVMGMDVNSNANQFQTPPRSIQRSDTFSPTTQKRTWAYYQDLKKKDRALYYSPKVYNQMLKDAEELGDAFKDGDYRAFGD